MHEFVSSLDADDLLAWMREQEPSTPIHVAHPEYCLFGQFFNGTLPPAHETVYTFYHGLKADTPDGRTTYWHDHFTLIECRLLDQGLGDLTMGSLLTIFEERPWMLSDRIEEEDDESVARKYEKYLTRRVRDV